MSTPVAMAGGARGGFDEVGAFVAEVRSELDDLSSEEIDELTGGLEADLADALAEEGRSPREQFGDPAAYAAELRAAAGLAPRPVAAQRDRSPFARVTGWRDRIAAQPWWPPVRDFLVVLRPTWWVLRAFVAAQLVWAVLGGAGVMDGGPLAWLLLIGFIVVSVQIGRRRLQDSRGWRWPIRAGNVLAVLLLPFALSGLGTSLPDAAYESGPVDMSGLRNGGTVVRNVFAYDAQGRPLQNVQLFDQDGAVLDVGEDGRYFMDDAGRSWEMVPRSDAYQQERWNAYPLQRQEMESQSDRRISGPQDDVLPLPAVPPLAPAVAAPTASPAPAAATASPTPAASPTPSPAAPTAATLAPAP